jgi:hypothetical protein
MLIQKSVESDQREALGEAKKPSKGSAFSTVPSNKLAALAMQDEWVKMTTEERDTFRASLAPLKMDPAGDWAVDAFAEPTARRADHA